MSRWKMLFLTSIHFLYPGKSHDNSLICPVFFYVLRLQTPERADTFVYKPANAKVSSHFAPWRNNDASSYLEARQFEILLFYFLYNSLI